MRVERGVVWTTIALVVVVMVLSGPSVSGVDFTRQSPAPEFGAGTARLSVAAVPTEGVRLQRARFGAGRYVLDVPDAAVRVYAVSGSPTVAYRIGIPALGYAYASTRSLSGEHAGRLVNLSLAPAPFDPDRVTRDAYDGTITVAVRDGDGRRVRYRANVTIGVRG